MTRAEAKRWMRAHSAEHIDECGDVNFTSLAESCACAFDCADEGGPLDDETHWIWDVAVEVGGAA